MKVSGVPLRNALCLTRSGYILQNTGHEAEEISFVVCDVNSEKERLQVNFFDLGADFYLNPLKMDKIGFMP